MRSSPPPAPPTHRQTVPTGFSGVPPPGPGDAGDADADVGAEARARAVGQRGRDLGRDRAVALDQLRGHAGERDLGLVGVDDEPAQHVGRGAREVGQPARHQPAGARLGGRDRPARRAAARRPRRSSRRPSENSASPWRARSAASKRVVRRLGGGREDGRDLELAAAQAGRDLQRSSGVGLELAQRRRDLGSGQRRRGAGSAARACPRRPAASRSGAVATAARPHRLQLARRPGQHDDQRPTAPARRSPARSRPARAPSRPRARAPACGCPRASRSSSPPTPRAQPRRRSPRSAPPAPGRAPSSRPANAGHDLGGEVVRGRAEPAAGDDQVHALAGEEVERRAQVVRAGRRRRSMCASSTPRSRSRSDSHGPLRSRISPTGPRCR